MQNANCTQSIGPCGCGAWHLDEDEFAAMSPVAHLIKDSEVTLIKSKTSQGYSLNPGIDKSGYSLKEFTRDDLFALHGEMTSAALELMKKKNADYSARGPFQNFKMVEARGTASAEIGILIRLDDKLSRLTSILTKGEAKVKDESIQDTCQDILNYVVCLVGVLREKSLR